MAGGDKYLECVCNERQGKFDADTQVCMDMKANEMSGCGRKYPTMNAQEKQAYVDCIIQDACGISAQKYNTEKGLKAYAQCADRYLKYEHLNDPKDLCGRVAANLRVPCMCAMSGGTIAATGGCSCAAGKAAMAEGTCVPKIEATDPKFDDINDKCTFWFIGCKKASAKYTEVNGDRFILGANDVVDISTSDVKQGNIGDCYYMAPLAAIARKNPDLIRNMIQQNPDGSYSVTFYQKRKFWELLKPEFTPVIVNVNNEFPIMSDGTPAFAKYGDSGGGKEELWSMIAEKAYAQYRGSYNEINSGGKPGDTMELITGKASKRQMALFTSIDQLADLDSQGYVITAGTWSLFSTKGVKNNHAYYVKGFDKQNHKIILGNPWGYEDVTLTEKEFRRNFSLVDVGQVR
jgi:hypothetical protein